MLLRCTRKGRVLVNIHVAPYDTQAHDKRLVLLRDVRDSHSPINIKYVFEMVHAAQDIPGVHPTQYWSRT